MKTKTKYIFVTVLLISFGLAGCSSSVNSADEFDTITEEDLEIAAQIVGESLSDENSGVMSSVYDAVSNVSSSGISYAPKFKSPDTDKERAGRGGESNFSYDYDPETGTHTIDFNRNVATPNFSKSVSAHLEYIFTDPEGIFIVQPKIHKDSIEAIDFKGEKKGETSSRRGSSEFTRIDSLIFTGLHESSAIFSFSGTHHGEGSRNGVLRDSTEVSSSYETDIEFVDVQIDKAIVEANGNLEEGVTGSVNYSVILSRTVGGEENEKVIEGEIVFEGDGTGLLRFKKFAKLFRLSLSDGEVSEES